jgi:hypothetical protein
MPSPSPRTCSVLVYGGTPAGVIAAVAAARRGGTVVLVEPSGHLGGLSSSGVVTAEYEHMLQESYSGLPLEVYKRIGAAYGFDAPIFHWEPHIAESVFDDLVAESGVTVLLRDELDTVTKSGARIHDITLASGQIIRAETYIDCTYEGDLMALSGAQYTWGRESPQEYGEDLAGVVFIEDSSAVAEYGSGKTIDEVIPVSPYRDGVLLEGFVDQREVHPGAADRKTANYHYRVTLSSADDRLPFEPPAGYTPERYLAYQRYFEAMPEAGVRDLIDITPHASGQYQVRTDGKTRALPGLKWEMNNRQDRPLSLGHLGGQFDYPDADRHARRAIVADHRNHNQGLLYFLANDPGVPIHVRRDLANLGLPADEYIDNDHWPYSLYVREARRLVGDVVHTQHDVLENRDKADVVGIASHWIDSHYVQRVAVSVAGFRGEGRVWRPVTKAYAMPYSLMLPQRALVENLLVPVAVSASRVAFCSLRVEAQWMALGEAAGVAASIAAGDAVQDVPIDTLQAHLRAAGVAIP